MFLGPPHPAAGSATAVPQVYSSNDLFIYFSLRTQPKKTVTTMGLLYPDSGSIQNCFTVEINVRDCVKK